MKKIFQNLLSALIIGGSFTAFHSCTEDKESENLYPDIVSGFTYTFNDLTSTYTFTNSTTDAKTYLWDFGDGTTSTDENPVHTYTTDGTYIVKLTSTNVVGTQEVVTKEIVVKKIYPLVFPIDFEDSKISYNLSVFGDNTASIIDNPKKAGINTTAKVLTSSKPTGTFAWGGSVMVLHDPIVFGTNNAFKMKVWSPKVGAVIKLKIENLTDNTISHEVDVTTTVANQWEELVFDFSDVDQTKSYQKIALFFDFNVTPDGAVYYADDIRLETVVFPPKPSYTQTFETAVTWTDFGGATTTVVANPHSSGINTSANVSEFVKGAGAQTWAGSFIQLTPGPINFTKAKTFKVKVWSPKTGIIVKLKVENATDNTILKEVDAVTTTSNQWEELTYDFSSIDTSKTYHKIVIFFDYGVAGDATTYYLDDIILQ